jgi:hypothetical protein
LYDAQVDALEFYPAALQQRLQELQSLQQAALRELPRPAAVVTFRCGQLVPLSRGSRSILLVCSLALCALPAHYQLLCIISAYFRCVYVRFSTAGMSLRGCALYVSCVPCSLLITSGNTSSSLLLLLLLSVSLLLPPCCPCCRRQLVSTLAAASLHSYDETSWDISPAPGPHEMLWPAVGLRCAYRTLVMCLFSVQESHSANLICLGVLERHAVSALHQSLCVSGVLERV